MKSDYFAFEPVKNRNRSPADGFPLELKTWKLLCGGFQSPFFGMLCNLRKFGLSKAVILNVLFILQKTRQSELIIDSIADKLKA